ncbi:retrotransposon ORF1 [Tanacetum coccineum]
MLLNEKRPIIETLKYGDKHKKFLDSVLLDKLKLDGDFELEDEIVGEQLIREYKVIKETEDPGCFVLPIHLEEKFDFHALIDTGSNINMIPYRIYELLDREKVKPRIDKVRMIDHSKAKTMGRLLDVLCQVEITTILANFMLLDVLVDRDVPIIVGRSFIMAKVRNVHEESDSDDEEEYCLKRDDFGRPVYGPNRTHDFEAGSSSCPKRHRETETVEEAMLGRVYHNNLPCAGCIGMPREYITLFLARLLPKQVYIPRIVDWTILNSMGCAKTIEEMLEIKGGLRNDDYFDANEYWVRISNEDQLRFSKSATQTTPILRVLQKMITYGLCQWTTRYEKIHRNELWLMSMFEDRNRERYANVARVIEKWIKRKGMGTQKGSMIVCGRFVTKLPKKLQLLSDDVLDGLRASIYYRSLDATTLRELISEFTLQCVTL